MVLDNQDGTIKVSVAYPRFAFVYRLFTPTIEINGHKERKKWGTHAYRLPPGAYSVSVSYPWLLSPECGKNSVVLELKAAQIRKVEYTARYIRYLPGKISVQDSRHQTG